MVTTNIQAFSGEVEIAGNLEVGTGNLFIDTSLTGSVGIKNTAPTFDLSVGSNLHISDAGSNVLNITGNVGATNFIGDGGLLSNIATTLSDIVDQGNTVANVVQFNSASGYNGVGLVTSSNVGIQNTAPAHNLSIGSNLYVNDTGANVLNITGNVGATNFIGDGGLLSNIATTLSDIVNQGNTVANVVIFNSAAGYDGVGLVTSSNVGIQNTSPAHNLSVGSNFYVDNAGANVLTVDGNIGASRFVGDGGLLSNIASNLHQIVSQGNVVANVIQLVQDGTYDVGLVTTSNVGIQNTAPMHNLSVGSNLYVNDTGSNVLTIEGNVSANTLTLGNFAVIASYGLNHVTGENNTTGDTIILQNATTGLQTTSNVILGGNVYPTSGTLEISGNVQPDRLKFDTNVFVDTLRVADLAANLVTYDRTTGEMLDSAGLFSNKLAVVSQQPPSTLTANATTVTNHGTYTLTTSNLASGSNTWNAFDGSASVAWVGDDTYTGASNAYAGSVQLAGSTKQGEWLALEFPYKTTLRHMKLTPLSVAAYPGSANLYATNNSTWTELKYWEDVVPTSVADVKTVVVDAPAAYRKYALVTTKVAGNNANVALAEWKLFAESFTVDGGKVTMPSSAIVGGNTLLEETGPHGRGDQSTPTPRKFPGFPMTSNTTPLGYVASSSSHTGAATQEPWKAFDGAIETRLGTTSPVPDAEYYYDWISNSNRYTGTHALYSGSENTAVSGVNVAGEWLQIEVPKAFKLTSTYGYPGDYSHIRRSPKVGKIAGSNDGTTWTLVHSFSDLLTHDPDSGEIPMSTQWSQGSATSFGDISPDVGYYRYYRLITTQINGAASGGYVALNQWELYGISEDDSEFVAIGGDTSVDVTIKSQYNTPAVSGYKLYLDGAEGSTATDLSTGPITVTENNVTYDATEKAWVFDGSTESNIVSATLGFEGDQPLSVSTWFKSSNLETNVSTSTIFNVGTAGGEGFAKAEAGVDLTPLITANTWHNLAFTSNGQGLYNHTYLDGKLIGSLPSYDSARYYPEIPLLRESQDGYNVSASSDYNNFYSKTKAFNNRASQTENWASFNGGFSDTINYTGTARLASNTPLGEWLKLEMPHPILMTHIFLSSYDSGGVLNLTDFKVYGSNDDTNWDELLSKTGFSVAAVAANDATKLIDADTSTRAYKYFALVITKKVSGSYQYIHVHELRYFGHRVNDLVRFPDSTTVRKFPDTVMASNGPQRGYTVSASGAPNTAYEPYHAFNNIAANGNGSWHSETSYATSGTRESTTSTLSSWTGGGGGHNGAWLKIQLPHKLVLSSIIFIQRPGVPGQHPRLFSIVGSNNDTDWYLVHEETTRSYNTATGPPLPDEHTMTGAYASTAWKYFAVVIRTGSTDNIYDHVAIGDWELYGTAESTPVLARLGGSFEGKIANTRVYDRSIGERQVLEVWDAEKDRFGRGESSITVHKGRLGVGTKTPQATLDVRGNIFGPLLTHRSYVWRKPGIVYVPAVQECRILAQVVEIPEMYKNISPLNLRLSYKWQWYGEMATDGADNHYDIVWRTNVKHSGNTIEHMNTGMEGSRPIGVTGTWYGYTAEDEDSTPEYTLVPGIYDLKNVTGDTFEVELTQLGRFTRQVYTNRAVNGVDNLTYERGCSTLTVFMEPY
jgi:hypothetical protein